jgi:uncharacterized protein (TIGR02594 family)
MTNPKWLDVAIEHRGLKEIPGPKHNSKIISWLRDLKAWWSDDETAWCGTFVAHCMQAARQPIPLHWYRAKGWAEYGSLLRPERLAPGAILVFDRSGGGHVAFYVGEDSRYYYVLGGNQANGVNVMKIARNRLIASRWPKGVPVVGKRVSMSGGTVSTNEA